MKCIHQAKTSSTAPMDLSCYLICIKAFSLFLFLSPPFELILCSGTNRPIHSNRKKYPQQTCSRSCYNSPSVNSGSRPSKTSQSKLISCNHPNGNSGAVLLFTFRVLPGSAAMIQHCHHWIKRDVGYTSTSLLHLIHPWYNTCCSTVVRSNKCSSKLISKGPNLILPKGSKDRQG